MWKTNWSWKLNGSRHERCEIRIKVFNVIQGRDGSNIAIGANSNYCALMAYTIIRVAFPPEATGDINVIDKYPENTPINIITHIINQILTSTSESEEASGTARN